MNYFRAFKSKNEPQPIFFKMFLLIRATLWIYAPKNLSSKLTHVVRTVLEQLWSDFPFKKNAIIYFSCLQKIVNRNNPSMNWINSLSGIALGRVFCKFPTAC